MSLTISDAEDAYLDGRAEFEEWRDRFLIEWSMPLTITVLAGIWQQMTPEQHTQLRMINPQAYDIVDAMIQQGG